MTLNLVTTQFLKSTLCSNCAFNTCSCTLCLIFRSEYVFNFDNTFELHNDIDVLKKMGLDCGLHSGTYTDEDVKTAKSMLPKALGTTLESMQQYYCREVRHVHIPDIVLLVNSRHIHEDYYSRFACLSVCSQATCYTFRL